MDIPPNSPTPDYGTLGPGSDIKPSTGIKFGLSGLPTNPPRPVQFAVPSTRIIMIWIAMTAGLGAFFYTHSVLRNAPGAGTSRSLIARRSAAQKDAEQLLQRATASDSAATAQIEARAATWRGQIALTPQLSRLLTVGLNAYDLRVRAAAIQLDLAAMNVAEDPATVDRLARQVDSTDHATRIWAIWTLGLIGSRGLQQKRITDLLIAHLADSDIDSRRWAVEGLSYVGTGTAIPPLLKTMRDDSSPVVREHAACALAPSGMFTNQQRRTTIPTLLSYAEDPSLDAPTHAWTYHALRDITAQHLPDDAAAWRRWYDRTR